MVSQLQKSKKDLETYVAQLDGQLDDLENKIEDLKEEITAKKTEIEETKADIEQAQAVADQQYEDMKTRLRYLYRNSKGNGYLELLVNAGSFADMLNQAGYVEQLSSYDSRKLEEYRQSVEYLELCKQTLEEEEDVLNTAQASLEKEQQAVNTLIPRKSSRLWHIRVISAIRRLQSRNTRRIFRHRMRRSLLWKRQLRRIKQSSKRKTA